MDGVRNVSNATYLAPGVTSEVCTTYTQKKENSFYVHFYDTLHTSFCDSFTSLSLPFSPSLSLSLPLSPSLSSLHQTPSPKCHHVSLSTLLCTGKSFDRVILPPHVLSLLEDFNISCLICAYLESRKHYGMCRLTVTERWENPGLGQVVGSLRSPMKWHTGVCINIVLAWLCKHTY